MGTKLAINPSGLKFGQGSPWTTFQPIASGNHQRPPNQLSQHSPQLTGNSFHSSMHPILKVAGVVHIWYYIPLFTIFAQQFNCDLFRTIFHFFNSRSQNPMPTSKEDFLIPQSGNLWQQSEEHSRTATIWLSPGKISCQSLAIDFTSHRGYSLVSACPPNLPQRFACLRAHTALQMRLQHCPPISILTTPYAFTPRPYHIYAHLVPSRHASNTASHPYPCVVPSQHCLPSLRSRSALPTCSQNHLSSCLCSSLPTSSPHCLPSLRLQSALLKCSRHHLSLRLCSALPTLLPILTLVECPPHMLPTPLILMLVALPTLLPILMLAECPPNTTYPYACVVPSQHAPDTAAHPYACGVPSQHAPNTTYPYASVLHP
ncbi:hypothetical protein O181_109429 [Austropuccinia psidii MF-1]|uniref:Uncharacterized protein n=1 Tax=Austropuccinia psidii MF-1 TaxID=1389203 RepID=A0A9Q3JWK1_9BASI|nr:hypothetical protein [Austropuccinia psidii MF-1]